ncbi:MAG: hypothetical protein CNIPEHKO_01962 [Anaerolineales bacterium]|nr:hypothetical protein [Anaerolineales bacterium]
MNEKKAWFDFKKAVIAKQSVPLLNKLADTITRIDPEETPWVKSYLT